jgi:hypothetical protein
MSLGFESSEISRLVGTAHSGAQTLLGEPTVLEARYLFVRLRAPRALTVEAILGGDSGELEFEDEVTWTGCVGRIPKEWENGEELEERWEHARTSMTEATESEALSAWNGSRMRHMVGGLAEVLRKKGFRVKA